MGCETSRSLRVEEVGHGSAHASMDRGHAFSELHVDVIRSTWPLLMQDPTATGCAVFTNVFAEIPDIKKVFPFRHLKGEKLAKDKKFRNHGEKFMKTVGNVVDHLEDLDNNDVSQALIMLGAQHATINHVDINYLPTITKYTLITWESVLGEEFTLDVRDAWTALFEYISNKMQQGYYLYLEDKANDSLEARHNEDVEPSVTYITECSDHEGL